MVKPLFPTSVSGPVSPPVPDIAPVAHAPKTFTPIGVKEIATSGASNQRVAVLLGTLSDPMSLINFGSDHIAKMAARSDQLLSEVADSDIAFVETQLSGILAMAQKFDLTPRDPNKQSAIGKLINKVKGMVIDVKEEMLSEFNDLSTQIDRIITEVENRQESITNKLKGLDQMYQENLADYREFDKLIKDLTEVMEIKQRELDAMIANGANDFYQSEAISGLHDLIDRLDSKIVNFKKFQMMSMQDAPNIKQMQNNAAMILSKFHDIKTMTIPLWKKQIRYYIDSIELRKGAQLAKTVDDANNAMIRTNSDSISNNTKEVTRMKNRAVIDQETAEHVHRNLIDTFNSVIDINKDAKQKRADSVNRMEEMKKLYSQMATSREKVTDPNLDPELLMKHLSKQQNGN